MSSLWNPETSVHKVPPPVLHAEGSVREATELPALKRQSGHASETNKPAQKPGTIVKVWVYVASDAQCTETYFPRCLATAQLSF